MTREIVLAALQSLPEPFEANDLIEQIIILEKIERGREQSRLGQTVPHEEVKQLVKTWFK